jgi:polysaccharide deacetylase family sporulation protein PdaB
MKKYMGITTVIILGLLAGVFYWGDYDLKLVPNKPDLRTKIEEGSPREATEQFNLSGGSERDNRGFPQRAIVDLVSLHPNLFFREGSLKVKKVALTFDDGPDTVYTPQIMDILKEYKVKATFFLIGNRAQLFPDVVKRMVREGHVVGNHSMTHANIAKLSKEKVYQEIKQAEDALKKLTGYRTALFRSPYGSLNSEQVKQIGSYNYKIIAWNVDSLDWKSLSAEQVKYNILENAKEGSIILQHSSGSLEEDLTGSVAALPEVIKILQKAGYEFVTIPELLEIKYKK